MHNSNFQLCNYYLKNPMSVSKINSKMDINWVSEILEQCGQGYKVNKNHE